MSNRYNKKIKENIPKHSKMFSSQKTFTELTDAMQSKYGGNRASAQERAKKEIQTIIGSAAIADIDKYAAKVRNAREQQNAWAYEVRQSMKALDGQRAVIDKTGAGTAESNREIHKATFFYEQYNKLIAME